MIVLSLKYQEFKFTLDIFTHLGQYLTNADGTPVSLAVSSVGDSILPTTETETVHTDSPATGIYI